jgi:protein TonB
MLPVVPPRPVGGLAGRCEPVYSDLARRRGLQGLVVLHVAVSPEGMPTSVTVARSSGHDILDEAALSRVRQCRFLPATQNGNPVAGTADLPFNFRLED